MAGGTVVVTITGNVAGLTSALGTASGQVDGFAGKMRTAGAKMQSIGRGLTMGLTLPIVGVGIASFKAAQDFESAWAGVEKTVDGSLLQMIALRQGIIDMAKELPASTTEIAAVAEAAGALGIQTDNVLGFTRVMIDLGETTDLTADVAATSIAQLANVVQLSGEDFDNLGAALVDLGNNGASTESKILDFATRLAGAGATVGLTTQQLLGISAAMADVGIEAEAGGTALQKTFLEMLIAAETGAGGIETFARIAGQSADEFATKFKTDAAGAFTDFITGLQRIDAEGGSVVATLDELGITEQRQVRAILSLISAGTGLQDSIARSNQAWEDNTALTEEASKRYDTNAARMEILRNRLSDVGRQIGEALVPILERLATWLTTLTEKWKTLSPETQKIILIIAGVTAVLGPLLIMLGAVAGAITALLSPVGLVIAALVLLVAAAVFVWTQWDQIWTAIKDHPAYAILFGILAAPVALFILIIGALKFLYDNWNQIWNAIKDVLNTVYTGVIAPVLSTIAFGINAVKDVLGFLRDVWNEVWGSVGGVLQGALGGILGPLRTIVSVIESIIGVARRAKEILSDIGDIGGSITNPGGKGEFGGIFDAGGVVPGPKGAPKMILAHGGETILPTHKSGTLVSAPAASGVSGVAPIVIQLMVGPKLLTELVVSELNRAGGPKVSQKAISS